MYIRIIANLRNLTSGKGSCAFREVGSQLLGLGFQFGFRNMRRDICNANHPQGKGNDPLYWNNKSCHNLANTTKPSLLKHLMHFCPYVLSWQDRIYKMFLVGWDKKQRKLWKPLRLQWGFCGALSNEVIASFSSAHFQCFSTVPLAVAGITGVLTQKISSSSPPCSLWKNSFRSWWPFIPQELSQRWQFARLPWSLPL